MSKIKGQSLILSLGSTAIACEKNCKVSYSNEYEDSTTKDTPTGKKEEEYIRTNISISFECLVGQLSDLTALKTMANSGTPVAYAIKSGETTVQSGNAVFDSFDIDATDRQNVTASGSMHDVYTAS